MWVLNLELQKWIYKVNTFIFFILFFCSLVLTWFAKLGYAHYSVFILFFISGIFFGSSLFAEFPEPKPIVKKVFLDVDGVVSLRKALELKVIDEREFKVRLFCLGKCLDWDWRDDRLESFIIPRIDYLKESWKLKELMEK